MANQPLIVVNDCSYGEVNMVANSYSIQSCIQNIAESKHEQIFHGKFTGFKENIWNKVKKNWIRLILKRKQFKTAIHCVVKAT